MIRGKPIDLDIKDVKTDTIITNFPRTLIAGHTHPELEPSSKLTTYSPPSGKDYVAVIESYFKRNQLIELIFEKNGMWTITLTKDLIQYIEEKFNEEVKSLKNSTYSKGYHSTDSFDKFLNEVYEFTNKLHILLMRPKSEGIDKLINIDEYCDELLRQGFDVKLIGWNDKFRFDIEHNKTSISVYNEIKKRNKLFNCNMPISFIINKIKETPFLEQVNNT
jgi:hypothetical protein